MHVRAQVQILTHLIARSHDVVTSARICTQTLLDRNVADFDVCFQSYWKGGVLVVSQHFDRVHAVMSQQQLYALTDMLLCGNICEEAVLCPATSLKKTGSVNTTVMDEREEKQQDKFSQDSSLEAPSSPYEPPPPQGPSPEGTPKNSTRMASSTQKQKMTPRKLLAEWLIGTRWAIFDTENVVLAWIDFQHINHGEIEDSNGSKRNITWSALTIRTVQIVDSQVLTLYFNESRTGFCCASNGNRGMLVHTQHGSRRYQFLVPDDANAPTIQSLLREGLFDTATTPGLIEQTRVQHHEDSGEEEEEEEEEGHKEDEFDSKENNDRTKQNDIKRHRSAQSSDVSVEQRMRAAEQLNSVVGIRWLTVNVSIENLELDVMNGYCGVRLNGDAEVDKAGHLGTLVAKSLRVVSHKCTLGKNPNCTGLDTLVKLDSIHLIGTSHDKERVRCLEINGLKDSDCALILTYGKRILPITQSRPRRNGVRIDSDEVADFFNSPATTACGIQTYTTSSTSGKNMASAEMKLIDPVGGLIRDSFSSNNTLDMKDDDDDEKDTYDTPDTLVGMSVKIGVASVYVTKEALDVYNWYMYPTEEMMQSMSEEVLFLSISVASDTEKEKHHHQIY